MTGYIPELFSFFVFSLTLYFNLISSLPIISTNISTRPFRSQDVSIFNVFSDFLLTSHPRTNMKPQVLLAAGLATVAIADQWPMAKEKCGRLGPMEWDPNDLPPDVDVMQIRMCADHPMGAGNYWGWGEYLPDWFPRNPFADMEIDWLWWP